MQTNWSDIPCHMTSCSARKLGLLVRGTTAAWGLARHRSVGDQWCPIKQSPPTSFICFPVLSFTPLWGTEQMVAWCSAVCQIKPQHSYSRTSFLHEPEREFKAFRFLTQVLTSKPDDLVLTTDSLHYTKPMLSLTKGEQEWLQLLKCDSPLVSSLVIRIRGNKYNSIQSVITLQSNKATEDRKMSNRRNPSYRLLEWTASHKKARLRKENTNVPVWNCSSTMNSTTLKFYQMSSSITALWQLIFVTATIIQEGAESNSNCKICMLM